MKKRVIFVLSMLLIILCTVHYFSNYRPGSDDITVFISIDCNSINGNYEKLDEGLKNTKYVPADGVILSETEVKISNGSTVLDLTKAVTFDKDIQLEYSQSPNDAYVQGINYIYEFSCGDLSGWMYSVNGEFAHVGCNDYHLKDGDIVKWHYTCDLGNDLNEVIK